MDLQSIADADVALVDLRLAMAGTDHRRFRGLRRLPRMWQRLLVPLVPLVLVAAAVGAIWLARASPSTEVAATITPSVTPTSLAPLSPVPTTAVDATVVSTSTAPPSTTTTTTTTGTPVVVPFIEPTGAPLSASGMRLHWKGIGNLRFGDDFGEVLGSLAATLGQPDRDTGVVVSRGEYGTCRDDEIRAVEWGPLAVVALAVPDDAVAFHSYEVDGTLQDVLGAPLELTTLSGLRVGDTVPTVEEIYTTATYRVVLGDDTSQGPKFEVLNGDTVMLWGPLSSVEEDGTVLGVFSPTACDG